MFAITLPLTTFPEIEAAMRQLVCPPTRFKCPIIVVPEVEAN